MIAASIVAIAFLVGSIPFGYLIGRIFYHTDIRAHGSGNVGAMNAMRAMGARGAIATLLLDAAKGYAAALLALHAHDGAVLVAVTAAAAVLGHCYSPWLGWKGGKGVATSLGATFAISPAAGLVCVAVWLAGVLATRYSSVGSMLANLAAPFALWYLTRNPAYAAYGIFAALFIAYAHRENIRRLRAGHENGIPFLRRGGTANRT